MTTKAAAAQERMHRERDELLADAFDHGVALGVNVALHKHYSRQHLRAIRVFLDAYEEHGGKPPTLYAVPQGAGFQWGYPKYASSPFGERTSLPVGMNFWLLKPPRRIAVRGGKVMTTKAVISDQSPEHVRSAGARIAIENGSVTILSVSDKPHNLDEPDTVRLAGGGWYVVDGRGEWSERSWPTADPALEAARLILDRERYKERVLRNER